MHLAERTTPNYFVDQLTDIQVFEEILYLVSGFLSCLNTFFCKCSCIILSFLISLLLIHLTLDPIPSLPYANFPHVLYRFLYLSCFNLLIFFFFFLSNLCLFLTSSSCFSMSYFIKSLFTDLALSIIASLFGEVFNNRKIKDIVIKI